MTNKLHIEQDDTSQYVEIRLKLQKKKKKPTNYYLNAIRFQFHYKIAHRWK